MNGEWVDGGDLQVGDLIQKVDGTHGVVQFNKIEYRTQTMYNLTVDIAHTFYVGDGDWLVHNCGDVEEVLDEIPKYDRDSYGGWNGNTPQEVFRRDDYTCQYCGKRGGNLEAEHKISVRSHWYDTGHSMTNQERNQWYNNLDNLNTSCRSCNRSKGAKGEAEFRSPYIYGDR